MPQRGEKRSLVDLANRNAALAYQTRFNQTTAARYDALEMLQHVLGLGTLPRRIECFDISTIQGSETVASMVVCEDGRMRRAEYRKFRIRGLSWEAEAWSSRTRQRHRSAVQRADRRNRWSSRRQCNDDFAAMQEVVLRSYRKLLEQGGPFPDLDRHRRRQGAAFGGIRGARSARAGQSGRRRNRQEGRAAVHARSRGRDRARGQRSGSAPPPADSGRGAPLRGDVPSARPRRCATFARSWTRAGRWSAPQADAADDVRQPRPACGAPRARNWRPLSVEKSPMRSLRFSRVGLNLSALASGRIRLPRPGRAGSRAGSM